MKKLIIVESPAKIKTISKFLGKDFKIMSTVGHIKDLPQKKIGVSLENGIDIDYEVLEGKNKVIADIVKEAQKVGEIYLAPDPDREGEIIAWHIGQEIAKVVKNKNKIHRITFNEITKPAIEDALEHPSIIDLDKVSAQQARRILDRWVGYEVSPILWKKITRGLSAGRVQSVALKLIVDREEAIQNFKSEEYWSIEATFGLKKSSFTASLTQINKKKPQLKNESDTKKIVKEIEKEQYHVESIVDSQRIKRPLAPFMTSSLQQAAYNRLGFNVQKTMQIAQKLYEGVPLDDPSTPIALITYMRTDSLRISESALKSVRTYIGKKIGKEYLPSKAHVYTKKAKGQDAHEAIRPIDVDLSPESIKKHLSSDEAKLYDLIWKRFVASQMKPAEYAQRQVTIQGGKFTFKVTGSTLLFDGFLKVYAPEEDEKEKKEKLPKELAEKQDLTLKQTDPKQHFTQPPPRYTEGSLVKEMEKEGIGRPSTYATILKTIRQRAYTELDKQKRFTPTELGVAVTKLLEENLPKIMNISFTAHMEEDLDKIASGELNRDTVLKEFYADFSKNIEKFLGETAKPAQETNIKCPECKKGTLLIRFGKTGPFLGCNNYPDCKFTNNFERTEDGTIKLVESSGPKLLDITCPNCGKQLREIVGRFGPFIACSGYPECKYIHEETTKFKCPECKKTPLAKKKWKGNVFWGCKSYPKCRFSIPGEIEEMPCPKCKKPYLLKRYDKAGDMVLMCHDKKECGYKEIVAKA